MTSEQVRLLEKMRARIRSMTTKQIEAAIRAIGGGKVDEAGVLARAELLGAYEDRMGDDAVDALMDDLGMYAST